MNKKKNTRFFDFLRIEDYNVANIKSQKNKEKEGNEQECEFTKLYDRRGML